MESIDITEMTDFRHINDVCFTQLPAQQQQQQQKQINTQGALNTSFHSCATDNFQGSMLKEQQPHQQREQQNPLLQSLIDYTHSLTTPPTTTIGNNYSDGTAAVAATASVCNARAGEVETGNLSMDGVHFDEHDIYYVSPTKRKSSLRATLLKQQQIQQQQYERFKTKSPLRSNTTTAAINCKQTRIATNTAYGSRLAGIVHDFSLDETSSHYSDTAMQVLRSGSISGGSLFGETQRHFALTNNNNNSNNNNNNHCYSHSHSSSNSSLVTNSERFQRSSSNNNNNNNNNNLVTNKQSAHRGSLQRFKGRSTQSLCSCDAGIEAEIDMQSTRPLYQYDVDGKMAHTYTCEQNAQILMRLARERQRKLSLGAEIGLKDSYDGSTITLSKGRTKTEKQKMQYYADDIPPIPPPPTLKRQTNSSFKQKVIERNCNSRSSTLETLCSNDVGSLLEDCTASILKCANTISNELSTGKTDPNGMNAKLADTCPTGRASTNYLAQPLSIDDIFMPRTHRPADLSLCFLHTKANSLGIGMGMGMGMGMENTLMRSAGLKTASNLVKDNRSLYKYNTIGPSNSSEFAKQLAHYRDQQKLEQKHEREEQVLQVAANRCRCFSKSLSSFQYDNKLIDSADNQLCYQGSSYSNLNRNDDSGGRHCPTTKNNRLQFPITTTKTMTTTSTDTSANILNDGAFVSLHDSSNTNSGLNHHQQHQYHHEHHYPHQDYLLHNHKPSITSAALHNQLLSTKVQHQQQKQKQKHQLDIGTQHQHPHLQTNVTNLMPWKHRQCPSRCSSSSGTNSLRFDAAKHWLAVSSILLIIGAASVAVPLALRVAASAPFEERLRVAQQLLDQVPLIDGHNDLPWNIRKFLHNKLNDFNFDQDLRNVMPWAKSSWSHTDLQRLKKGRVSAQFWAAYVPCEAQHRDAVQLTLEQIDVIKRLTDRYYPQLVWCTTSADIIEAHKKHQMCSLTGVEGGHSIGGSLAVMRTLYAIGVRYMTLTSTCHTPWADSSAADAPTFNVKHGGLTIFGKTIIREMNRLGMMVDLSHVSKGTMHDAIEVSEAPVIFSHSSAYALCNSSRNVQDDTLQSLAKNGGIVMVNFYSKFLSCNENATVHDAVAHINHIRRIAGVDHVGLGAGFDGINFTPKGLEDVSTYPTLFAELVGAGWNVEDLTKLAGGNFLRVMKQVEKIRDEKRKLGITPYEDEPSFRTDNPYNCTTTS